MLHPSRRRPGVRQARSFPRSGTRSAARPLRPRRQKDPSRRLPALSPPGWPRALSVSQVLPPEASRASCAPERSPPDRPKALPLRRATPGGRLAPPTGRRSGPRHAVRHDRLDSHGVRVPRIPADVLRRRAWQARIPRSGSFDQTGSRRRWRRPDRGHRPLGAREGVAARPLRLDPRKAASWRPVAGGTHLDAQPTVTSCTRVRSPVAIVGGMIRAASAMTGRRASSASACSGRRSSCIEDHVGASRRPRRGRPENAGSCPRGHPRPRWRPPPRPR